MKRSLLSIANKLALPCVFALALFARLWLFGQVPGDINQDEAFAGYEAWALLNYGVDSSGHPWPVYLTAWGSGMNALESYLMLPFIAAFGLKVWVIRLPQLTVSLLSVWAAYCLGRRLGDRHTGLICALLLAICPWHILMSRWGLESNLAPGFMLFGLCFFLRGLEDGRFLCLSALMYGLALYAYAAIWAVMPVILLLELIYGAAVGRLRAGGCLWLSGLILALLAAPLLLFLLVNYGYMDEIVLPYFSIPKLPELRGGEISLGQVPENLGLLLRIVLGRSDGLIWNSPSRFGIVYLLSLPLMLLGAGQAVRLSVLSLRRREPSPAAPLLIQLLGGIMLSATISVNVNRVNILLPVLVIFAGLGVDALRRLAGRAAVVAMVGAYLALFLGFQCYYFTDYRREAEQAFTYGAEQAIEAALGHRGPVYVCGELLYPKLLFYSRLSPLDFAGTVEYRVYPAKYLEPRSFDRFSYDLDTADPAEGVYILSAGTDLSALEARGYTAETYGGFTVAYIQ